MDLNDHRFNCPTSGKLLGIFVRSFSLDEPDVGGDLARFLSSDDNAGRNARRYFSGEAIPSETRDLICRRVAAAAVRAGLVDGFIGPPTAGQSAEQFLKELLRGWLDHWDTFYHRASEGWPHPPQALGGFVVGRQAVIDLALRVSAMMQLCGFMEPEAILLAAISANPGRRILDHLQESSGKKFTRMGLVSALQVAEKSTIDGWIDDDAIPNRDHLKRLAKAFSLDDQTYRRRLRWLMIQYGLIDVARRLRSSVGAWFTSELLHAFAALVHFSLLFSAECRKHKPMPAESYSEIHYQMLSCGALCEPSAAVLDAFLKNVAQFLDETAPFWIDDLRAAATAPGDKRIEACFSIIGDWPTDCAHFDADKATSQMPLEERRLHQSVMALLSMSEERMARYGSSDLGKAGVTWAAVRGWQMIQSRDFEQAIPLLEFVVKENPEDPDAHCHLGMALVQCARPSRVEMGRRHLLQAMRLRPNSAFPLAELARSYLQHHENLRVLEVLETASGGIALNSEECTFVRALALKELGRYPESLLSAERASALDSGHAEAWSLAADLAFLLGDRKKGRRYQKQAAHLGHATVLPSGIALPGAICPNPAAARSTAATHNSQG